MCILVAVKQGQHKSSFEKENFAYIFLFHDYFLANINALIGKIEVAAERIKKAWAYIKS